MFALFLAFCACSAAEEGDKEGKEEKEEKEKSDSKSDKSEDKEMVLGFCSGGSRLLGHEMGQRLKSVSSSCVQICFW